MYEQDRNGVFTSPDTTKNNLAQFQLSGSYFVDDTFTVTGQIYRRNSRRHSLGADAYTDGFSSAEPLKRNLAEYSHSTDQLFSSTLTSDLHLSCPISISTRINIDFIVAQLLSTF